MREEINSKLNTQFLENWNNNSKKNKLDYLFYKIILRDYAINCSP